MAKMSKTMVDKELRERVFDMMLFDLDDQGEIHKELFQKINDRQYGVILKDANGNERYVRVGAIVAELREDISARELMEMEIREYEEKQAAKAEKEKAKAEKIAKDKAKRAEVSAS